MNQQSFSQVSPTPARRSETVVEKNPVLDNPNTNESSAGTSIISTKGDVEIIFAGGNYFE